MFWRFVILLPLFLIMACTQYNGPRADLVVVEKSKNQMHLFQNGEILKTYNIALGGNPIGHKQQRGDMRTPEGKYMLDYKNNNSKFYRSINISYPNEFDVMYAQSRGLDPGDDIVIHGLPNGTNDTDGPFAPQNWTEGCIAVMNYEMDEIWQLVQVDTPIYIKP